jgi:putative membrane protein
VETANAPVVSADSQGETGDALRRTRLANERTYLAWWRTGLATFAVGLAAGKLVPELSRGASWPFELIGVVFAVVGIAFIAYAYVRQRQVEEAVARGGYAPFDPRAGLIFATVGIVLGLGTIVVILVESGGRG